MSTTSLAYERHGSGAPVVFLHGLTFDRRSWRPIIDRLGGDVAAVAIDLPAHGESPGPPADLDDVAARVHELVDRLGIDSPVVVGHSISGAVAMIYAASYPSRGAVSIDNPFDLRPFGRLVRQMAPALRGPAFAEAFAPVQQSMRLDLLREPVPQEIRQDVVLGYWDEVIRSDPDELQARVEAVARTVGVPCLALFGDRLTSEQRAYIRAHAPTVEVEVWPGCGHFLHLVEPDRFTARLRRFGASVAPVGGALERDALEHVGDGLAGVDG
jgi:pimeloyl-ACP methyl ester carboxylesterase